MVKKARQFALQAHGKQMYGDRPYSYHLDAVASLLKPYGATAMVVGYLHDTVEDTSVTVDLITDRFGSRIARCVDLVSDPPGRNRRERKIQAYARLASVDPKSADALALIVKTADRLANLQACTNGDNQEKLAMYLAEHDAFVEAVFRPGLCDDLWRRIQRTLES